MIPDQSTYLADALFGCAKGDRQSLRLIFDREAPRLVAVAERIVRRRDLAEDVVQEAFIRIWTCAHQYTPERGSARGWIYAIVRNRALNMLRDGKREDLVAEDRLETLQETDQLEQIMAACTGSTATAGCATASARWMKRSGRAFCWPMWAATATVR